jgi:hypothetical protein
VVDLPSLEFRQERFLDEGVQVLVPSLLGDVPIIVRRDHMCAFGRQGPDMLQGRPVCQIIGQQKRVDLSQAQEEQQRQPAPGGDRLEVQAGPEQQEQHSAERFMSPKVPKHSLFRADGSARQDCQPLSIAERGYRPPCPELNRRELTRIFRLLLLSDPGPVEDLTGDTRNSSAELVSSRWVTKSAV